VGVVFGDVDGEEFEGAEAVVGFFAALRCW
jgi:hypothetical protein